MSDSELHSTANPKVKNVNTWQLLQKVQEFEARITALETKREEL